MPSKTILVLANSVKNKGRCIAGREIVSHGGHYHLGPWLRPVSEHGQGELGYADVVYDDAAHIAVLDFATVRLAHHAAEPCQPENWRIDGQKVWTSANARYDIPPIGELEEQPENLWLDPSEESRRISHEHVMQSPLGFSLCVIRPRNLQLVFWTQHDGPGNYDRPKSHARFAYNGVDYDLSLTDPLASERYGVPFPTTGQRRKVVPLRSKDGPLICVSLTPDFNGHHYKVVATILGM